MDILIILISFLLSLFFLSYSQSFFLKKKFFDPINSRSSHTGIATRNGGISIYLTLLVISVYFYLNNTVIFDYSYFIPLSILLVVGLYDDIYDVDFKLKFLFQIIIAKILIDSGFIIDNFHGILGIYDLNRIFAQVFTAFIIVAIINSINFIDGVDGLAISVISIFIILFEFFSISQTEFQTISAIILTSFLPLLYFNYRAKNKIFLGDSGSLLLGGIVSIYVLNILSSEYVIKKEFDINKMIFVISILTYPIIDIIRVFFLRLLTGKSPFIADKKHIHHILLRRFKSHIVTSLFIIFSSLLFTILLQLLF
jgi:UDP-GlcNAc:undecaprenyl-phosphate/decaprenyl-phosphate GlcNAc-1-phosphate transferase